MSELGGRAGSGIGARPRAAALAALCLALAAAAVHFAVTGYGRVEPFGPARLGLVLAVLALGGILLRRTLPRRTRDEEMVASPVATRAWRWSIVAFVLFAPVWVTLLLFGRPPEYAWTRYPYLDKRWLVLAYWSGVGAVVVLPPAIEGLLHGLQRGFRAWRRQLAVRRESTGVDDGSTDRRLPRVALGLAIATLLFGPPWNAEHADRFMDLHEAVHWSGLQAIDHGAVPYVGAASNNYGPGMQLAIYAHMKLASKFSIPGFRESFGLSNWLAMLLLFGLVFLELELAPALLTAMLMVFVSPMLLWGWGEAGALNGFFGWASAFRHAGSLLLALSVCELVNQRRRRLPFVLIALGTGLLWGLLAYWSQENLVAGAATLAILLLLLWLTGTLDSGEVRRSGLAMAIGAGLPWSVVAVAYGAKGLWREFLISYTLVPARFARGYANTPYSPTWDGYAVAYYTLPYLVVVLALAALYRTRPLRTSGPLARHDLLLLASCVALLTAFPASLLRSDFLHLIAVLFPLPVVATAAIVYLPRRLEPWAPRWTLRGLVLALLLTLFVGVWQGAPERTRQLVVGRWASFDNTARPGAPPDSADEVESRFGPAMLESYGAAERYLRKIKEIVGERPTLVLTGPEVLETNHFMDWPLLYAGYFYFLADLVPGPVWLERTDLVANSDQLRRFVAHFEAHIDEFECIVSTLPESEEIALFKRAYPDHWVRRVRGPRQRVFYVYGTG